MITARRASAERDAFLADVNRDGYKARFSDKPLTANPYRGNEAESWEAGWLQADQDIQQA